MQKTYKGGRLPLPLKGLQAVEAVLRHGNLSAAAAELCVTPGAVSQQVIKAEAILGVQLFKRQPHGLAPTATAQKIAEPLHRGFADLANAVALSRPTQSDRITISVPPVFAAKWLVWRLHRFSEQPGSPKISIQATTDFADLRDLGIDACVRAGQGPWPGTTASRLADIRVFPACAPDIAAKLHNPEDLLSVPIIRDGGSGYDWNTWLHPNGMDASQLPDGPIYSDASLCLDAAIAGQGVFLAWETLAHDAIRMGRLTAPMPGRFKTGASYWLVESAGRPPSPSVQPFAAWLRTELEACLG